jgi:hypothetical protein
MSTEMNTPRAPAAAWRTASSTTAARPRSTISDMKNDRIPWSRIHATVSGSGQ